MKFFARKTNEGLFAHEAHSYFHFFTITSSLAKKPADQ